MKKRSSFLILFAILMSLSATAQRPQKKTIEGGFLLGVSGYQGDLVPKYLNLQVIKPAFGGILRYHQTPKFNIRASAFLGTIEGDDKYSESRKFRQYRFKSSIIEGAIIGEWNILGKKRYNAVGVFVPNFTPYLLAGVGGVYVPGQPECYDPACQGINNPFPEEDDRNFFVTLPIGAGIRFDRWEFFTIGLELAYRTPLSDYLDGVSKRGRSDKRDWYYFGGLTFTFIL